MLSLFNIRNKPVFVNQVPVHMGRVQYASPRIKGSEIAPPPKGDHVRHGRDGRVQPDRTCHDTNPCALWHGERQG